MYEDGQVFGKNGTGIKQRPNSDGYACFIVGKKGKQIAVKAHWIVGELFIPNQSGLSELDIKDCDRMNPAAWNLERVSHQENVRRAWDTLFLCFRET